MNRRSLLAVGGWLITVLIATGAGVTVIAFLGQSLAGTAGNVLTAEEARRALATASPAVSRDDVPPTPRTSQPATAVPGGSPGPSESPSGQATATSRVITTSGGTAVARCEGDQVTLRSWSPAQGYQVDGVDPGPDDRARVKFRADEAKVEIEIHCTPTGPVHTVKND